MKLIAITLSMALVLSLTTPALAKGGKGHEVHFKPPGQKVKQFQTNQYSPDQEDSGDGEDHGEDTQVQTNMGNYTQLTISNVLGQLSGPINNLQVEEAQFKSQTNALLGKIKQQIAADKANNNYTALKAAVNDIEPFMNDIQAAKKMAQASQTDWTKVKADQMMPNDPSLPADVQNLTVDIQSRIATLKNIMADLQRISNDLSLSSN